MMHLERSFHLYDKWTLFVKSFTSLFKMHIWKYSGIRNKDKLVNNRCSTTASLFINKLIMIFNDVFVICGKMAFRKSYTIQDKRKERNNTTIEHMLSFNDTMEYEKDYDIVIVTWCKVHAKNAIFVMRRIIFWCEESNQSTDY